MPQFMTGESKTARIIMRNPTGKAFDYTGFLYMGTDLAVVSEASFSLGAGQEKQISFPVVMPAKPGTYPVHVGIFSAGQNIALYRATEGISLIQALTARLLAWYAEFGYWFESEILDINGKVFTSANLYNEEGAPLPATISEPVSLSNPRGLQIRWRNLSIRAGTFANLQVIVMYLQNQSGIWSRLPRYTKTCPLPPIGGETLINVDQIYWPDADVPETWPPGVYNIFIGVYGILASGFSYGLGGVTVTGAVRLI